MSQEEYLKQY
jgi:hypothetical protein